MMTIPPTPIAYITASERLDRLARLRQNMAQQNLDAVVLTPGSNMRYMAGLGWGQTERLVCAIITPNEMVFVCPKFEDTALFAGVSVPVDDYVFWEEHENPCAALASWLGNDTRKIALDINCSFGHAVAMQEAMPTIIFVSTDESLAPLRSCKSPAEIALITAAMEITLDVHAKIFNWIKPGMKSSEVKAEINRLHRAAGADNGSSFCAVQFGEATSHPHGVPGDPALQPGELILIDTGCRLDGYNSDITRSYAIDKVDAEIEKLWDIEKEAQAAAFAHARLGLPCGSVDGKAREVLGNYGLGPDYILPGLPHRTGHGIGLDIHEGPYLVRGDDTPLAIGMCFSNEPMIVIPGKFGIRLEDHFYMTETGAKWFTEPQKSLYEIA